MLSRKNVPLRLCRWINLQYKWWDKLNMCSLDYLLILRSIRWLIYMLSTYQNVMECYWVGIGQRNSVDTSLPIGHICWYQRKARIITLGLTGKDTWNTVTDLEAINESVMFTNSVLGNYFLDSFFGNAKSEMSPFAELNTQSELFHCTLTDAEKD